MEGVEGGQRVEEGWSGGDRGLTTDTALARTCTGILVQAYWRALIVAKGGGNGVST